MYQRVFYGKVTNPANNSLKDLFVFEKAAVWPCAAAALVMGVAPILWLGAIDPAVQAALTPFTQSRQQGGGPMIQFPAALLQMMPQTISQAIPQSADYIRILPELVLSAFGIVVMLLEPLVDEEKSQKLLGLIAFVGAIAALLATWYHGASPGLAFSNMVKVDGFSVSSIFWSSLSPPSSSSVRSNTWRCSAFAPENITPSFCSVQSAWR
jgi:uncharacterized membrane protein